MLLENVRALVANLIVKFLFYAQPERSWGPTTTRNRIFHQSRHFQYVTCDTSVSEWLAQFILPSSGNLQPYVAKICHSDNIGRENLISNYTCLQNLIFGVKETDILVTKITNIWHSNKKFNSNQRRKTDPIFGQPMSQISDARLNV
jgi:hypothetical protein